MLSAFGVDHGVISKRERKDYATPGNLAVAGGLGGAIGASIDPAKRGVKVTNKVIADRRAAGHKVTRGMAGMARAGGAGGAALGHAMARPGLTAGMVAGGAAGGLLGGKINQKIKQKRQSGG